MRKILNTGIRLIAVLVFAATLAACLKDSEGSIGLYRAEGDLAENNNEMMITGPKEVSAAYTGTY